MLRCALLVVVVHAGCRAPAVAHAPASEPVVVATPAVRAPPVVAEPVCDPTPPASLEREEPDPDDPDAKTRGARAGRKPAQALAARVTAELPGQRAACDVALAGPCAAQADLDGDGKPDELVLVRSERGEGGLAILWGKGGAALLGAGVRCQAWTVTDLPNLDGTPIPPPGREQVPADLDWLRLWEVWRREGDALVSPRERRVPATGASGDAVLLDGGDAAVLVHRGADGWVMVHLGY